MNVPPIVNSACAISNLNAFVPSKFGFLAVSLIVSVALPASLPAFTFAEELAGYVILISARSVVESAVSPSLTS